MIPKYKEKFCRKNIKSVVLKSTAVMSGGVEVLSANASTEKKIKRIEKGHSRMNKTLNQI
jgi:hypothetical protein